VLVLSSILILLIAGTAAAADESAPVVAVPEDVPGADVIVFFGDAYDFDASSSTDDTGIVDFMFEFNDGMTPVTLYSTTGKVSYTFTGYGQTWVIVHAWDAAANEGLGYFSIDVVEVITSDSIISDTIGMLGHSIYLDNADLTISNSTLYIDDGAGKAPSAGGAGIPDMLGESLTPDGDLAGHWEPYYWNNYWKNSNPYYGEPTFDTDVKLSGEGSIKMEDGYRYYGMEYHFDNNVDLTEYNAFTYYMHSNLNSDLNYMYYIYFYGSHDYSSTYGYMRQMAGAYQQGGRAPYLGWQGYTIPLDTKETGWFYSYRMTDLSSVACIRIYFYMNVYNYYTNGYALWIDNIAIQKKEWGDEITESTSPSGEKGGYWSGASLSSESYVGDYSVRLPIYQYSYNNLYYFFDQGTDISSSNALRFFLMVKTSSGQYTNYNYYWPYSGYYNLYIYDTSGNYAYYRSYSYTFLSYAYEYSYPGTNHGGPWYSHSLPWGEDTAYYNSGVDFTKISYFRLANIYFSYSYPSSNPIYMHIDGLEWYGPGDAGGGATDKVPYTIYMDGGDLTIDDDSTISGMGSIGARIVNWGGNTQISHATLDNIWHTEYPGVMNGLNAYGGVEIYGDAVIDNVTFTNCAGPGLALYDGTWTIDKETVSMAGTALSAKQAPMIIMGATERTTGNFNIDVSGWNCEGSPGGTGILISTEATSASVTVTVSDNDLNNNGFAGLVISNYGGLFPMPLAASTTANLDVTIRDQTIEDSGSYGIVYYAGGGTYDPNVWGTLLIDNVTVRNSGEAGLGVWLDMGATNLDATIVDSIFERNSGAGAGFMWTGFFGECNVEIENTSFRDNSGSGMELYSELNPWDDGNGNIVSPVASINFDINGSFFQANSGWGIVERLNGYDDPDGGTDPPWTWTGPTRTTLWYNITMTLSDILENQAGGWYSKPDIGWFHGDMVAKRDLSECLFTDNRGPAIFIEPEHHMEGGSGIVSDIYMYDDCRIIDNSAGIVNYLGNNNQGYYGEVHVIDTRVEDNDGDAIEVIGDWSTDGLFRWGLSRVRGMMYYVDGSRFNTPLTFQLMGADDSGGNWAAIMGLQFTNNIVDIDEEITLFALGAYPNCNQMTAWAEIGNNRFYRGFPENGLDLEMFGGYRLDMDVKVFDQVFDDAVGSGLNFVAGTLASTSNPHIVGGKVMVDNVTVTDAGSNGINFTITHRSWIGAKSLAVLEVNDMLMDGVGHGIKANDLTGAVYNTIVNDPRRSTIELQYCTFDFFSCDVGPVDISNIRVLTKGAARLWYDVGVDVKWASGARVMGAVVSVQDNTWSTIAVDTVDRDEVLGIGYVNSYTVLPDTTYSKSPFLLTGTYLGLTTEKSVDIKSNTVVDLILVDDVLPRLTVNLPLDGSKQRQTSLEIKGHAWDMHSGLKEVLVSIDDGFTWMSAIGEPEFLYVYDSVPEGNLVLRVKAVDEAGNERIDIISVLVDATPPPIIIIEPMNDVILTQDPVLSIIGVTEMGATVLVDNVQVPLDHTLFSTTIVLKEGVNEVRIVALDRLGNSAEHVIKVELDTIAPPLIITAPISGVTIGERTVRVYGQTEAGATVYINGQMAANQVGSFSHTVILNEGPNFIMVSSEDMAGNMATAVVSVMVDTSVPWLQLASPMDGDVFGGSGIDIIGWVEASSIVTVNDQEVLVEDAHFSTTVMGSEGRNLIVVTVSDLAGNEYSETVEVWFDTTAPVIHLWTPEDGLMTSDDTVEITGTLMWNEDRESFRDITLSINGDFAPFAADGEFRIQYLLVEGTNPLFIRATDDVGNSVVTTVTVYKDSMAPFLLVEATPTFDHPTWNKPSTYNELVYIEGTTEPGAMVTVEGAGVEVDETGYFNISILLDPVPEGEELTQRSIIVVSADAAGNSVEETVEVYRLQQDETDTGIMNYDSAQYWVLLLSIIILVVAIVATTFMWKRIGARDEEYDDDTYLEEV